VVGCTGGVATRNDNWSGHLHLSAVIPDHVDVGVSAQQLQAIDNRLVSELSDGSLMVNEPALVTHLAKALQEQQSIIQSQADTITAMEVRLTALENK
jgi:hypothetical protein